jgi:predicted ribosomally synthesized peptide with SipW-like signal peptide
MGGSGLGKSGRPDGPWTETMTDERYQLTRRKALAGLATVGAAGAGAGLGTSALFSDTESFEDNSIQAGTLNMTVELELVETSDEFAAAGLTWGNGNSIEPGESYTFDGDEVSFAIADAKPGDWFVIRQAVCIEGNAGYVQGVGGLDSNDENSVTEPEAGDDPNNSTVDPDGDIDGSGELAQNVEVTVYEGDWTSGGGGTVEFATQSLQSYLGALSTGIIYRGGDGHGDLESGEGGFTDPTKIGGANGTTSGLNPDVGCVTNYTRFEIPDTVGNEIQSDSVQFDFGWEAEQARNNDPPSPLDDAEWPFESGSPGDPSGGGT